MSAAITVIKNDHAGREVWRYSGHVLDRGPTWVRLEARFNRPDVTTAYHTFRHGDRFVEWFFSDRWYNIFEMHDVDDDHLVGWYCNVTRPATLKPDTILADDLALDVLIKPDGRMKLLDKDEFVRLPLDPATHAQARRALADLMRLVKARQSPFDAIPEG